MAIELKAHGVFRVEGRAELLLVFNRAPTDDEMRAVHNFLRGSPTTCPFCRTPTYALPCTQCGEPDVPDGTEF